LAIDVSLSSFIQNISRMMRRNFIPGVALTLLVALYVGFDAAAARELTQGNGMGLG
jgi:hypothetical protein